MSLVLSSAALSILFSRVVFADLIPTAPGPGEIFIAGDNCTIRWNADQSGTWKNVTIDLMTGSNTNMSRVTNVISGLDGTDITLTPFNWTCPEVDPYSTVYFYQFTNGGQVGQVYWTTRFTIASPNGEYVDPENSQQANGDPIPWGTGSLVSVDDEDDAPPSCMTMEQMEQMVDKSRLSRRHSNKEDSSSSDDDSDSGDSETKEGKSSEDHDQDSGDDEEKKGSKPKAAAPPKVTHKTDARGDEDSGDSSPTTSVHKVTTTHTSAKVTHTAVAESTSKESDATPTTSSQSSMKSGSGMKAKASTPSEAADPSDSSSSSVAPTPGLPKKAHSSSSGSSATKTAQDPESTCQCSAEQRGGIQMNRSEARMVPIWALVVPLFTGLVALY